MSLPLSKNKPGKYVHIVVMLALMLLIGKLPAPAPMTELGMQIIGIFVGMAWGWIFVDLSVASILGLVALGLTSLGPVSATFKTAFGHDTVLLLLFVFATCGILEEAGLTRWLALKIVGAKVTKGRPWVTTLFIMAAAYVCALGLSPTASMLVIWSLVYGIAETSGYAKGDKWPMVTMVGVFMAATLAGVALPFKGMPAVVLGIYGGAFPDDGFNYLVFFLWMLVVSAVACGLYLLAARFLLKPDVSKLKNVQIDKAEKLTGYQLSCCVWFIVYIVCMLLPSILPKAWALTGFLKSVGNTGITAAFFCIWLLLNFKDCPPIGKIMTHMAWPVLFCVGSALTISVAFLSEGTGISEWIVAVASPVLSGKSSLFFIIVVSLIVAVVTQLCNNIATAALIAPIATSLVATLGLDVNLKAALLVLILASSMAPVLPSGSAMGAILHSNKDWVPGKNAYLYGGIITVLTLAAAYAIGVPLAGLLPI